MERALTCPPSLKLALKHRQNKTQRQRIIILIGSPLENIEEKSLIKLGKKLKKNNVAVDVVTFTGEDDAAPSGETMAVEDGAGGAEATGFEGVLKRFVEAVGSGDNRCVKFPSPLSGGRC